jgi:hypothetical protein
MDTGSGFDWIARPGEEAVPDSVGSDLTLKVLSIQASMPLLMYFVLFTPSRMVGLIRDHGGLITWLVSTSATLQASDILVWATLYANPRY